MFTFCPCCKRPVVWLLSHWEVVDGSEDTFEGGWVCKDSKSATFWKQPGAIIKEESN